MQREFTFLDFLAQMTQATGLGPTTSALARRFGLPDVDLEAELRRLRAVCGSMTPWERDHVEQLDANRRRRIAAGAGVTIIEVSQLIRQFEMTQQMMQRASSSAWSTKIAAVLGLVTSGPVHRDPSFVAPLVDHQWRRRAQIAVAVALCAFVLLYALVWHG